MNSTLLGIVAPLARLALYDTLSFAAPHASGFVAVHATLAYRPLIVAVQVGHLGRETGLR